jgi:hypothetical protein
LFNKGSNNPVASGIWLEDVIVVIEVDPVSEHVNRVEQLVV